MQVEIQLVARPVKTSAWLVNITSAPECQTDILLQRKNMSHRLARQKTLDIRAFLLYERKLGLHM